MNKKSKTATLLMLTACFSAHSEEANNSFNTSAKIENFCTIKAKDINFGVVSLPLTSQTASSKMEVLCTSQAAYQINLAYGGVYGTGTFDGGVNYSVGLVGHGSEGSTYTLYQDSTKIGNLVCFVDGSVSFANIEVAKVYGYSSTERTTDTEKTCKTPYHYLISTYNFTLGTPYNYGVMNGLSKGDKLAYQITLPDDATKVWNSGNNMYQSVGNGLTQEINVNASLVPMKSSSNYLAQDSYLDTVTVTINY